MTGRRSVRGSGDAAEIDGPFTGELTVAQRTFLEGQLQVWDNVYNDQINPAGRNGMVQSRVESVKEDLVDIVVPVCRDFYRPDLER